MKKKLLLSSIMSLLLVTTSGCNPSNEEEKYSFTKLMDEYGVLPQEVTDANLDIDIMIYIEGQRGTITDIGNYSPVLNEKGEPVDPDTGEKRKYGPKDIAFLDLAKFVGAAQAFKKYCPDVRINVTYCSIYEYNNLVQTYREQYKHLPHIMHPTDKIVDMLSYGYAADLSQYSDAAYYNSYNEFFMSRYNFGGFQAAIPLHIQPWGIFVNTDDLERYHIIDEQVIIDGENSSAYKDYVDNFTWESFMDTIRRTTTNTHAGISMIADSMVSISLPTIYDQYIRKGNIDLTSPDVTKSISKLLEYENEIALNEYSVYNYTLDSRGLTPYSDKYPEAHHWSGTKNFCQDQYSTFYAEAPWAYDSISQYVVKYNLKDSINVDILPYPTVDGYDSYSSVGIGGLVVGNQCPIGADLNEHCARSTSKLEQEVAAYFAMFLGADPRAIEARSKVKYVYNDVEFEGSISLPLVKKDFRFDWQNDPELAENDPSLDYDDNWQYQMALWFDLYEIYITNDQVADVDDYRNIPYGLTVMLDNIYGDEVTAISMGTEPDCIYEDGNYVSIFDLWDERHTRFVNTDSLSGSLGTSTYVSEVLNALSLIENRVNNNSSKVYTDLNDQIALNYGDNIYDVFDRTYRNSYEGYVNK